jgi:hypothetical protein
MFLSLLPLAYLQFGAKFGGAFGRVMFSASAEDAAPAAADLAAALTWLEGQASSSGPFILGPELSLVRGLLPLLMRLYTTCMSVAVLCIAASAGFEPQPIITDCRGRSRVQGAAFFRRCKCCVLCSWGSSCYQCVAGNTSSKVCCSYTSIAGW